jgi:hypothetical protein
LDVPTKLAAAVMPENARAEDINSRLLIPRSVGPIDMETSSLGLFAGHAEITGRFHSAFPLKIPNLTVLPRAEPRW